MLDVGDGHALYWEACGNPDGQPAVVLHGGPGSGCTPGQRRLFDPHAYRVVLFDQRGCGRSRPRVQVGSDLSCNTTGHLLSDLERLRLHLSIERWLVYGVSWGSTLGLVYAETHPERVAALVLSSVTMTRPGDIRWLYHDVGRYHPEAWQRFRRGVAPAGRDGDLVGAYYRLLNIQPDPQRRRRAADEWCAWEDAASPVPRGGPNPRYADPDFRVTFARIVTHYFHHVAWLGEDQILHEAGRLSGIPGVLVHGRDDLGSPLDVPWLLSQAWSNARLVVVGGGHTGGEDMSAAIVEATDRFSDPASKHI